MSVPPRYNYSEDKGSLKVPDHRNTFYLEEKLDLHPVCIGNSSLSRSQKLPYYIAGSNIHQASFVLTDDQVRYMNRTCGFCSQEYMHGREYMSTFSVYDGVRFWNSMMR